MVINGVQNVHFSTKIIKEDEKKWGEGCLFFLVPKEVEGELILEKKILLYKRIFNILLLEFLITITIIKKVNKFF